MQDSAGLVNGAATGVLADPGVAVELFKYAEVGRCVNSVTHDVNNYLGAILAYAELVSMDTNVGNDSRRMLSEIIQAVHKSTALLGTLTTIARKERPNMVMADLGSLVARVVDLRGYEMKLGQVDSIIKTEGQIGLLVIDEPKIVRALVYLIMNAIEHFEGRGRGRLTVTVRGTRDAVDVMVKNSGEPIPEQDRPFIFEPFFTTKGGWHLGLGLTHAREIAQRHGGDVSYDPETGFLMHLPKENGLSL